MTVDFEIRKVPEYRLATRTMKGSWPGDKALRFEFERIQIWANKKGIKTGRWVFREFGEYDEPSKMRFEVGIEIRGKGPMRGDNGVSIKTLPASAVAVVTFDPEVISPRVIYHGLTDWLRWQKKERKYEEAGAYREVYEGNPWSDTVAWAHTQVQVPVKKLRD